MFLTLVGTTSWHGSLSLTPGKPQHFSRRTNDPGPVCDGPIRRTDPSRPPLLSQTSPPNWWSTRPAAGPGHRTGSRIWAWPRSTRKRSPPGLVYASRLFRAPAGGDDFPVVSLQADPREATPGRMAFLTPVERGRWHVTLAGTRGGEPTADPDRFEAFARQARHPLVADLIAGLDPLTEVYLNRSCSNRRRFFERHTACRRASSSWVTPSPRTTRCTGRAYRPPRRASRFCAAHCARGWPEHAWHERCSAPSAGWCSPRGT